MYFYIDESGHTGRELFDKNQMYLYYGVLSYKNNLDLLAPKYLSRARKRLGVDRLHANELGVGRLVEISDVLKKIQKEYHIKFDLYSVYKPDHSIIVFFDQVFDQGNNPAVPWTGYWTPLRYVLLLKVSFLFDEDLAKKAWKARIELNDYKAEKLLVEVLSALIGRVDELPDERSRKVIGDSLNWALHNPQELSYNCSSRSEINDVLPNMIGFQSVLLGIAKRLEGVKQKSEIVVDRQSQFNSSQKNLLEFYQATRNIPWFSGPGLPKMDLSNIPETPIRFSSVNDSPGLEIVDVLLWIFKRYFEGKELPPELISAISKQGQRGRVQNMSLNAISEEWESWFLSLPEYSGDELEEAKKLLEEDEERRKKHV